MRKSYLSVVVPDVLPELSLKKHSVQKKHLGESARHSIRGDVVFDDKGSSATQLTNCVFV